MLTDFEHHDDHRFRAPVDLAVNPNPGGNVLVIGSCLVAGMPDYIASQDGFEADYLLFNFVGNLPDAPPRPVGDYVYQIIQIALRSVLPEALVMRLPVNDVGRCQDVLDEAIERLHQLLHAAMIYNRNAGLLTFIPNFLVPQQNAMGRLLPRYDLRNPSYLVEKLNEALQQMSSDYKNTFVVDFDGIAAGLGKKYVQDDGIALISHGAVLADGEHLLDMARIQPAAPLEEHFTIRSYDLAQAFWHEMEAMRRTLDKRDAVKLVIVDLDDTLWRGVVAEEHNFDAEMIEGWPLGFAEALLFSKSRGIMLAIVSKNDETTIRDAWSNIYGDRLLLDDFVSIKINWNPKPDNVADILNETNITPASVVFIDDNPVEREAVKLAFPDMRVLGEHPYFLRRTLLWAPETQVQTITDESARRTDMVKDQIVREHVRARMSREEFLDSLEIELEVFTIQDTDHENFHRSAELVNKTNQFNTTGQRWSSAEFHAWFAAGGRAHAFSVRDRFSYYGLVGVMLVQGDTLQQMVMSCRVFGLDVEFAALKVLARGAAAAGFSSLNAILTETPVNLPCRDVFRRSDFTLDEDGKWQLSLNGNLYPSSSIIIHDGIEIPEQFLSA